MSTDFTNSEGTGVVTADGFTTTGNVTVGGNAAITGNLSVTGSVTMDARNIPTAATFVVGTETGGNVITVAVQVIDGAGNDMAVATALPWYLSSDSAGLNALGTAPTGGVAAGTDGSLFSNSDLSGILITEADGDCDVAITDTGTPTMHLNVVINGRIFTSGAITFA